MRKGNLLRVLAIVLLLLTAAELVRLALDPDGIYGSFMGHADARRSILANLLPAIVQAAIGAALVVSLPLRDASLAGSWIGLAWAGLGAIIWVQLFVYALAGQPGGLSGGEDLLSVSLGLSLGYVCAALALRAAIKELRGAPAPPAPDPGTGVAAARSG